MFINLSYIKILVLFFLWAVIQLTLVPFVSIGSVAPDLIVILIVFYTLHYGQIFGTVAGFVLGFLFDLMSGGLLGAYMFSKTFMAFIVGFISNENKIEEYTNTYLLVLIVFIASTIEAFIYGMIVLSENGYNFFSLLFLKGLLPGIYTAALTIPFLLFKKRKGLH